MTDAATPASAPPATTGPALRGHAPARPGHGGAFRQLLSELNPLQYIPVVGTIYRAITGDVIPETARMVGSFVVSGLEGGPIGLAMNAAITAVEKVTGFDPEKLGTRLLADIGIGARPAAAVVPAPPANAPARVPTPDQLMAYAASQAAVPPLLACDVLNQKELDRLHGGVSALV